MAGIVVVAMLMPAVMVLAGSHTLPCRYGRDALDRNGQCEGRDSKDAKNPEHQPGLYAAQCRERMPVLVMRMDHGVALAARDQPSVHRERG